MECILRPVTGMLKKNTCFNKTILLPYKRELLYVSNTLKKYI